MSTTKDLTITIWNANGLVRQETDHVTNNLFNSDLIFITETWLLPPLQLQTTKNWTQYHTFGSKAQGTKTWRGQRGISLLINPNCHYNVTHLHLFAPEHKYSQFIFSCQISDILIHCVYLPPSLSDEFALDLLESLPKTTHHSQNNTIICGDFNARNSILLGDTRSSARGTKLGDWITVNGLTCWNAILAKGIPT
ncbi:Endonuclease/exonuclease/phosphatase, partial [Mucor mucedo]|uniref:Endonuclease/exonuclease/phosphatase n=1 Tax=Mucor mucedo TaxID=29922 RepID=UPI00221FBE67